MCSFDTFKLRVPTFGSIISSRASAYLYIRIYITNEYCFLISEGLDGGSGIHYSLNILPIIHLIKILGYSPKMTNYSLKVRKVAKKLDYSLFINFFFNSLTIGVFIKF